MKEIKKSNKLKVLFISQAAMIAAIYVVVTLIAAPLSFGPIQLRFSEALTILPFFTPAAIPGIFIGCLIANLLGQAVILDVIFGSLASLIAAVITYSLRKKNKYFAPVAPIVVNALIIPFVIRYGYGVPDSIPFMMVTVGIGQILSAGVLGMLLFNVVEKHKHRIFKDLYAQPISEIDDITTTHR